MGKINPGKILREFDNTLMVCLNCITTVSMLLRDVTLGLAEVQRAWHYSVALLDWMEAAKGQHEIGGREAIDPTHQMGAFVWTDQHTLYLWHNKVPVYYIHPYHAFDRQVILSVKSFFTPILCDTPATPPYPVILANSQAGCDDKFVALHLAAATCFMSSSLFENMHLPSAYTSSYGTESTN
ncbi:hypothetical protein AAF712_015653, partial [Marasmius tenuissimus]